MFWRYFAPMDRRKIFFLGLAGALLCTRLSYSQKPNGRIVHQGNLGYTYVRPRQVDVWLPPDFSEKKRYPVLYMQDGQNLFDPKTSSYGTAWEVDSVLTALIRSGQVRGCIVVGIWGTDRRFQEYAPAKPYYGMSEPEREQLAKERAGLPLSDEYLKFIVEELKPYIDQHYPTKPDRKNTFVAGSSMGGLISLYAALEYPKVFGGAACVSTHWPLSVKQDSPAFTEAMLTYLEAKLPQRRRPKLYFDYGTTTLDAWYEPHQLRVDSLLRAKGYTERNWITRKYEGAAHNEAAWQQRVAVPLRFLLGR